MRVTLLPSSVSGSLSHRPQYLTSYLVNDSVAFDAGSLGFCDLPIQTRVRHLFISHSHMDHVASLPIFVDNLLSAECGLSLYGRAETLTALRRHLFNGQIWPDMFAMSLADRPFITIHELEHGQSVLVDGLRVTPAEVNHTVPTFGYVVEDDASAAVLVMDTGPTQAIWDHANTLANLQAVFLEVSFPNSLVELATATRHLTPRLFERELEKLHRRVPTYAVHIKATFQDDVVQEINELGLSQVEIVESGRVYELGE